MKRLAAHAVSACALALAAPASATVLTFEELGHVQAIPSGYGGPGFTWSNFFSVDGNDPGVIPSGFHNGIVSGKMVAAKGNGPLGLILNNATPFALNEGYFTGSARDGLTVSVFGFAGDSQIYSSSFTVDSTGPILQTFNWSGLTSVQFASSGGTQNPAYAFDSLNFVMDDLRLNEAVPEPATWAMMLIGFGLVGGALRSRRGLTGAARTA